MDKAENAERAFSNNLYGKNILAVKILKSRVFAVNN